MKKLLIILCVLAMLGGIAFAATYKGNIGVDQADTATGYKTNIGADQTDAAAAPPAASGAQVIIIQ